ncbi:hypothetical protein SKAU_G00376120 [Synaphobranchus kaupii]|uniref:Uncharacterized protein n=1 Tax=Synaphobranchus kaupii TaxID=118154 RepID=A0A9Q1IE66_SYNKA|nr:hypothetical protein SKAU_G00376120 [Synaphobranchus kaupii]
MSGWDSFYQVASEDHLDVTTKRRVKVSQSSDMGGRQTDFLYERVKLASAILALTAQLQPEKFCSHLNMRTGCALLHGTTINPRLPMVTVETSS